MNNLKTRLALAATLVAPAFFGNVPAQEVPRISNLDVARMLNQAFADVAEKVSPSVVVINVVERPVASSLKDSADDSKPREFWRRFRRESEEDSEPSLGQGSGIIIREDGYILTNRHVVEDAERIEVRLHDGRSFKGTVRGVDIPSDVAVVKIEARGLRAATLADSTKTRVGEFAIAIGSPFSLDYSVTYGHVSAKGRSNILLPFEGVSLTDQEFIQTDASINPGNSGGPLVNIEGEVIGINTLIRGLRTGIGFAIPSSLAREVADQIVANGKFTRAWLGVEIRSLREEPELRERLKAPDEGVLVAGIRPDGPAAKSELRNRDIITAVNGRQVNTVQDLRSEIRAKPVGQPVTLNILRNGKATEIKVSPGEWSPPVVVASRPERIPVAVAARLGLTLHPLTRELAKQFGLDKDEGIIVVMVEKNTPAERQGLRPGDIIIALNETPTPTIEKFQTALKAADLKKGVAVKLQRGDRAKTMVLKEEGK